LHQKQQAAAAAAAAAKGCHLSAATPNMSSRSYDIDILVISFFLFCQEVLVLYLMAQYH